MPFEIDAYQINDVSPTAKIRPLSVKRDWVQKGTSHEDAYSCFPLTLANTMGYEIYFEEDIEFIWDGTQNPGSIKVTKGKEICHIDRGTATISLSTNLFFKSNNDTSLLCYPVPNQFIDGLQGYFAVLSTSFFQSSLPIVLKITQANKNILIKSGTPIGCVLPISIADINNSIINVFNKIENDTNIGVHISQEYNDELVKKTKQSGKPMGWYKKAIDQNGKKIGEHEIKKFIFNVNNKN